MSEYQYYEFRVIHVAHARKPSFIKRLEKAGL